MDFVYNIFNFFYQFSDSFAYLILSAVGLAIIFGMMGIINFAYGEFIMLGAYITTLLALKNVPLLLAIAAGTLGVGLFGLIIDRLIIRHLYDRPFDSVVATWGISLILNQGMLILMGPSLQGVSTPLGSFNFGKDTYSTYRIMLVVIAIAVLVFMYWWFMHTRIGLQSRATMQNHEIASSLGINTAKMYSITFMLGSAFAGLTGGLYAPTMSISPSFGSGFLTPSFVTVVVGGANPLVGTFLSGGFLGLVSSVLTNIFGTLTGQIGLLLVAIVFIRILPNGFSELIEKRILRRG